MTPSRIITAFAFVAVFAASVQADLRTDAEAALRNATAFYDTNVAAEGGYLWRYSSDLTQREGEGTRGPTTVWVQPPGTPAVGLAYVRCYEATGDARYLTLAKRAARVLLRGQMRSGGWTAGIELAAADRGRYHYRIDPPRKSKKARNISSFDDDQTQSAVRLLMRVDTALDQRDADIHEAVTFALDKIVEAQFPNGAWSQVFEGKIEKPDTPPPADLRASLPDEWSRVYTGHNNYWRFYTLNDNAMLDTIEVMFEAADRYDNKKYRASAVAGCDFLLLAQLPDPQPAWAQQYDYAMHPCWARKFEPPAVTGGESQAVMQSLLVAYRRTGDRKYLAPIPRAIVYLKKSRLSDGKLARFYELKTNRPLYFTRDYKLTHDPDDAPTHYSFAVSDKLDRIERDYKKIKSLPAADLALGPRRPAKLTDSLTKQTRAAIDALDQRGAWVTDGKMKYGGDATRIIDMAVYIDRLELLADYLEATR